MMEKRYSGRWLLLLILSLVCHGVRAQEGGESLMIRARVYDSKEPPNPLVGASVKLKGRAGGTVTDGDGYFTIRAQKKDILVITLVGYKPLEYVLYKSEGSLNLSLKEDVASLDEVVVTGLTKTQRKHIASSVATLDLSSNVAGKPITALSQALQGGITGVQVSQTSGLPGGDAAVIKIRGTTSLNNTDPLVLVDGIPGDLNYLDPTTVESITVLKDAAAAAQYGSRGANGVIVVTTKRGVAGQVSVNYDGYAGVQQAAYMPRLVDAPRYMEMYNEGLVNNGKPSIYSSSEIENTRSGTDPVTYPNTNWVDLVIGKYNLLTSHSMGVSGGSNVARFALSANYLHQDGMIPNTKADNYQIRANTSTTLNKDLSINLDMYLLRRNSDQANRPNDATKSGNRILQDIYRTPPNILPKYPKKDGMPYSYGRYVDIVNPYAVGEIGGKRSYENNQASINLQPVWKLLPGVNVRGQFSYRLTTEVSKTVRDAYNFFDYYSDQLVQTWESQRVAGDPVRTSYIYLGGSIDYTKSIGEHHFYAISGYSQEENNTGSFDVSSLVSGYAKLNYTYGDKYLLEGSIRTDGSSKFGPGHKWGVFPAVALGWNLHKEAFLDGLKAVKNWKLRASYGTLGNENIGLYQYQSTIDNTTGTESIYGNPDITWESVGMLDLGMDISISHVDLTVDYYNKVTSNIILYPTLPLSGGFLGQVPVNAGKVRNRGIEASLNYTDKIGRYVRVSIRPGVTYNRNRIMTLKGGPYISGTKINEIGGAIGSYYGYKTKGLLQAGDFDSHGGALVPVISGEKPGDIRYLDQNGDGVITADDQLRIGDPTPSVNYFTNIRVDYKNFNIEFLLQGTGSAQVPLTGMLSYPLDIAGGGGTPTTYYSSHYWRADRVDARFPRINTVPDLNKESSDFWFQNSAYLRVKYIQLGYTLSSASLRRLGFRNMRVYLNAQNPFTMTGMKLEDPETRGSEWTYGIQRTYTAGVSINF